jgi:hypothetical protein
VSAHRGLDGNEYGGPAYGGVQIVTPTWSEQQTERIGAAQELEIAPKRTDGTMRRRVPIWVVCVDRQVYVRTWNRRETGWFGQAVDSRRARIWVPGLEAEVVIEDVGAGEHDQRANVDDAYREKYGHYGRSTVDRMVTDAAAASTLRLEPEAPPGR